MQKPKRGQMHDVSSVWLFPQVRECKLVNTGVFTKTPSASRQSAALRAASFEDAIFVDFRSENSTISSHNIILS
jgi:hypothetical protein